MWGNFYLLGNDSFDTQKFKTLTRDPEMWTMSFQSARFLQQRMWGNQGRTKGVPRSQNEQTSPKSSLFCLQGYNYLVTISLVPI